MKNIKKYSALGILPIIALTSCTGENSNDLDLNDSLDNLLEDNIWDNLIDLETSFVDWQEEWDIYLPEGISEESIDMGYSWTTKDFSISYLLPNATTANYSWKLFIENWVVVSIEPVWTWTEKQREFFDGNMSNIIWSKLEDIEIDTVSWASLVSESFRWYLSSVR